MHTEPCKNCNGDGQVGNGDKPWLKQGHLHTCEKCQGTGKVPVVETEPEAPAETQTADVEEKKSDDSAGSGEQSASADAEETVSDSLVDMQVYKVIAENGVDFGNGIVQPFGETLQLNSKSESTQGFLDRGVIEIVQ